MSANSKSDTETSGRRFGQSPDTCHVAVVDKPFIVRGKITFALGVEAEEARYASDLVRDALDSLTEVISPAYVCLPIVHEWEVLPEQIERSG